MGFDDCFPRPRQVTERGATVSLAGRPLRVDLTADAAPLLRRGAELLERAAATAPAATGAPYPISLRLGDDPAWPSGAARDEAYALEIGAEGAALVAATPAGAFLGCQTLRQLLRSDHAALPAARVVDWPDLRYRGLYVESKWGPDRMSLADWKALVDEMATRKFNSLGVGVYGCWVVQYGGKRTEFLMLPFPDHPALATPKTLRYYSPAAAAWETLEYLPTMVTEDFFGELVAYAKAQNVTVRPHFNCPGHNTLIPRAYPEVSAKDETGNPIGYGFCLADPRTYELIFALYDRVIARYLRPNGVDWFHIGLDEVEAYAGIDEADPTRMVEPWCRCPLCRDRPRGQQLQEYAVTICAHLKEQGIGTITMWNDALEKLDALDETFVGMLEAAGVRENVVVQWWRYREPVLVPRPEIGVRAWTTPMAGYWPNMFTHGYTANISAMLLHGARAGAEGADAYCIYDPAFDRNYALLAQLAWDQTGEDPYAFKRRYAQALLGARLDPQLAVEAFDAYDQAFDSMPWTGSVLASLLYYWHTYPAARARGSYPRDIVLDLAADRLRLRGAIGAAAAHARRARDLFAAANRTAPDRLLAEYRVECDKLVGVWEVYSQLLAAVAAYEGAVAAGGEAAGGLVGEAAAALGRARERLVGVMGDLEGVKQPYLLPQILRDLSILLLYVERLAEEIGGLARRLAGGGAEPLPPFADLATNRTELDRFVSSAAAPPAVAAAD